MSNKTRFYLREIYFHKRGTGNRVMALWQFYLAWGILGAWPDRNRLTSLWSYIWYGGSYTTKLGYAAPYIFLTLFCSNRSIYRLRTKFTNRNIACVNYQNKCSNQSLEQVHKTIKTYVTNNHQKIPKCRSRDKSTATSVSKQYNMNNAYYIIHTYKRL
jgi:hypothetical protein